MFYTIISVSNRRAESKRAIREQLSSHTEVTDIKFYSNKSECFDLLQRHNIEIRMDNIKAGELGIWCSQISIWQWVIDNNTPIIAFEDDAIIKPGFDQWYESLRVPESDICSLFVPTDQFNDWQYEYVGQPMLVFPSASPNHNIDHPRMSRAYQGYSGVALQIWPSGAHKLLRATQETGIIMPVDCFIFETGFPNNVRKFTERTFITAPQPRLAHGVAVDWKAQTHIHDSGLLHDA